MVKLETTILKALLKNEEYTRKVLPFLQEEYFVVDSDKVLFRTIKEFILKYNVSPTFDALQIDVDSNNTLTEETVKSVSQSLEDIKKDWETDTNTDWLVNSTEEFCQERAIHNAIMKSIEIMGNKTQQTKGAIPQLLSDALAITFDPNVGHDYFDQSDQRYEYYHRVEEKVPFDLDFFNKITKGGVQKKTLNIVIAGTGVGKSLFMCHVASSYLNLGKNVLYITMELAEEEVAKRIDANQMNITFDDLIALPKDLFQRKVANIKNKTNGTLIVKEYPTAAASVTHFRALLNELYLKKSFRPDAIMIDYLNICASSRLKLGSSVNSYTYIKAIAEELRGLAVEFAVPIWSATQVNRAGFNNSDFGLENTSESFGLPATADFMFGLHSDETLDQLNQIMVKQLKNRYNDPTVNKRFVVGIDRSKMKLFDLDASAQKGLVDANQVISVAQEASTRHNKFKVLKIE